MLEGTLTNENVEKVSGCRKALVFSIGLALPYLVESLAIKISMLTKSGLGASVPDLVSAWKNDYLFMAALSTAMFLVLFAARRSQRIFFEIAFAVSIGLILTILAVSYYHFDVTGDNLSAETLIFWIKNFSETNKIVAQEFSWFRFFGIALQPVLAGAAFFALRTTRVTSWAGKSMPRPGWKAARVISLFLLGSATIVLVSAFGHTYSVISECAPYDIVAGAIRGLIPRAAVVVPKDSRMDGPIEVMRHIGTEKPKNVILIIFEGLNSKNSTIGNPGLKTTPFLAELARDSVLVKEIYSVVPHTTKAIIPIICGYPPYLETSILEAEPDVLPKRGLAHLLGGLGFTTAFFQTAGNFEDRDGLVRNMGYQTYRNRLTMPQDGFAKTNYFGYEENMMLEPSLTWLDEVANKPFFLTYLTLSTHHGYDTPPEFPQVDYGVGNPAYNRYLNAVRYTDGFIKRVYEGLSARRLLDETLLVIVGDHGEAFGEHGEYFHNTILWEEGIHTFAIFHYRPGLPRETTISGPRSTLDIVPSICDVLGLTVTQGGFMGKSVFVSEDDDRLLNFSAWPRQAGLALKKGDIKYIYWPRRGSMAVYNLRTDPQEKNNLAYSGVYTKDALDRYKRDMIRWADIIDAQYEEWERKAKEAEEDRIH